MSSETDSSRLPFLLNDESQSNLTCGICLGPVIQARRACTKDHFFCRECFQKMKHMKMLNLEEGDEVKADCPKCRAPMKLASDMEFGYPAPFVDEIVATVHVKCTTVGCDAAFPFSSFQEHMKKCQHVVVDCPLQRFGCAHRCKRADVERHLQEEAVQHLRLQCEANERSISGVQNELKTMPSSFNAACSHIQTTLMDKIDKAVLHLERKMDYQNALLGRIQNDVIDIKVRIDQLEDGKRAVCKKPVSGKEGKKASTSTANGKRRVSEASERMVADSNSNNNKKKKKNVKFEGGVFDDSDTDDEDQEVNRRVPCVQSQTNGGDASASSPAYDPTSPASYSPSSPPYNPVSPSYDPIYNEEDSDDSA